MRPLWQWFALVSVMIFLAGAEDVLCCTGADDEEACANFFWPTSRAVVSWNGGNVQRWLGVSLCRPANFSLPGGLLQDAAQLVAVTPDALGALPKVRVRECPQQGYLSQMSGTSGCEAVFSTVTKALQRDGDTVTMEVQQSTAPSMRARFTVSCGETPTLHVSAAGVRPSEYVVTATHPDACVAGTDDVTVSLGDMLAIFGALAVLLGIVYHLSVNAFVHQRRGFQLLEPLPSAMRRCCRWCLRSRRSAPHSADEAPIEHSSSDGEDDTRDPAAAPASTATPTPRDP
jgi:hypothetical protein